MLSILTGCVLLVGCGGSDDNDATTGNNEQTGTPTQPTPVTASLVNEMSGIALREALLSGLVDTLIAGGFAFSGRWVLSATNDLVLDQALPKGVGVYAFVKDGFALYVGVATMGLAKRLYFYGKPGVSQRTSLRLNGIIKNELLTTPAIDIYIAQPPDLEWNGLPVHGSAGLELGLIKKFALPWNMRSAG